MSLELKITTALKEAMKSKNQIALTALRAVKSAILLHKTQKSSVGELSHEDELRILQKLVKQRKESADIYNDQGRNDLADPEIKEAELIQQFLPKALSQDQVKEVVKSIIDETGAEILAIPRINIHPDITEEEAKDRKWNVNEAGFINWPDFQMRIHKKCDYITWTDELHTKLTGSDKVSGIKAIPPLAMWHIKSMDKQNSRWKIDETGDLNIQLSQIAAEKINSGMFGLDTAKGLIATDTMAKGTYSLIDPKTGRQVLDSHTGNALYGGIICDGDQCGPSGDLGKKVAASGYAFVRTGDLDQGGMCSAGNCSFNISNSELETFNQQIADGVESPFGYDDTLAAATINTKGLVADSVSEAAGEVTKEFYSGKFNILEDGGAEALLNKAKDGPKRPDNRPKRAKNV